jgi:ABC-type phosphonate transport system ATPase subunit
MVLMMCAGLQRLKSLSLTKVTASGAVVSRVAFETIKGNRKGFGGKSVRGKKTVVSLYDSRVTPAVWEAVQMPSKLCG